MLPDNVIGETQHLSWAECLEKTLDCENPWFQKYVEFLHALVKRSDGRYPVSHGADLGPTDLHALLRGSFTEDELRLVRDSLDPRGLYLHIHAQQQETDTMRPILGM